MRRTLLALGGTVLALASILPSGAAGAADKPVVAAPADDNTGGPPAGGFATWADLYAEQNRLAAAADAIVAGGRAEGFGGIVVAAEIHQVVLHWRGTPPPRVAAVIADSPVPVVVRESAHAEKELIAASQRMIAMDQVTAAAPQPDGSGLMIGVRSAADLAGSAHLRASTTIPLTISVRPPSTPSATKLNDVPLFWGAARVQNALGGRCSTAFGVFYHNRSQMLTAAHCFNGTGDGVWNGVEEPAKPQPMGNISAYHGTRDVALIDARSDARIYTGNFDSSTNTPVSGMQTSYVGLSVCRSSASSNSACGIKITFTNMIVKVDQGDGLPLVPRGPVAEGDQIWHVAAGGDGDSGGAVFTYRSGGAVNAVGIHSSSTSAPGYTASCTGTPENATRKCSWRIQFVDVSQTLAYYGVNMTLLTQ